MLCNEQKTRETTLVSLIRDTYTESGWKAFGTIAGQLADDFEVV